MSKIPKYIHYCWFGGKPIPKDVERYIDTWKRYMPEYKIIRWDERNFNIDSFRYTREAYEAKKYAFVSDVVRLYALNKVGGIYLDVDVEVVKRFDVLFGDFNAVLGSESEEAIGTGFLAFVPNHKICRDLLEYYKNSNFKEQPKMFGNTKLLGQYIKKNYKIDPPEKVTTFNNDLIIYPQDYFTAYNGRLGINEVTENTVCIHHFIATWVKPAYRFKLKIKMKLKRFKNLF